MRFSSHELMNEAFTQWYLKEIPFLSPEQLARHIRISNELGYALIEMLLDGDDEEETFQDDAQCLQHLRR
ncbi:MAG: hypothetical protein AB8C02_13365 [Halioglobus sp.]